MHTNISIHAPLAGCDKFSRFSRAFVSISIHAPLAGCDEVLNRIIFTRQNFNPRTPCGVRHFFQTLLGTIVRFQSTHPLRGATRLVNDFLIGHIISIHAPLAGCDCLMAYKLIKIKISIHAPLAGCDAPIAELFAQSCHFNPRTPCGVRPVQVHAVNVSIPISIHAPLAGCDARSTSTSARSTFQSTHPLRGATFPVGGLKDLIKISIHAPLAGCDMSLLRFYL